MRGLSQDTARDTLQALGVTVLIVGFFKSRELASQWAREAGCAYPILLDTASSGAASPSVVRAGPVYRAYGFTRRYSGTWSSSSLHYYASAVSEGASTHPSHGHDVYQLGGDIVLYPCPSEGCYRVYAAHYSEGNTDRVAVHTLLEDCKQAAARCIPR